MGDGRNILVSVFVVTYNQEKYIRQCLDSILLQKVDFDYEIVIGEDSGTDMTLSICEEYARKYSQIRLLPKTNHLGIAGNWKRVLSECRGKYVAMCEGDDYWCDPLKLQKQVDFLEGDINEDFVLCFHDSKVVDENNNVLNDPNKETTISKSLTSYDLMTTNNPPTQTIMFRRKYFECEKTAFMSIPSNFITCDAVLCFLLGKHGGGCFMPQIINSAYRVHSLSTWSALSQINMDLRLFSLYSFLQPLENRVKEYYFLRRKSFSAKIATNAIKERKIIVFLKYYFISSWLFLKSRDFKGIWNIQKGVVYNLIHK